MIRYITRLFARQVIRRIAVIAVGALFMLVPALWGGLQANAASIYDDVWINSNELKTGADGYYGANCDPYDVSENWVNIFFSADTPYTEIKDSFRSALDGDLGPDQGRWAVSQVEVDEDDEIYEAKYSAFLITWTEDDSLGLHWTQDGVLASGNNVRTALVLPQEVQYGLNYRCEDFAIVDDIYMPISARNFNGDTVVSNFFVNIDENKKNIPEDYEGQPIRDTPTEQGGDNKEKYTPKWKVLSATNWNADIRDTKFSTIDGIFWTCSEDGNSLLQDDTGLAPVIEWEMWQGSNKIDDGILSSTAVWSYQFDKVAEERVYTLKGRYDCGGSHEFNQMSEIDFTITSTGMLAGTDYFDDCFTEVFPFIHFGACINNIGHIMAALSFGQIHISGLSSNENCRNLQVLGGWIGRPNELICPQFSAEVRNTITPFVTFMLGIFTTIFVVHMVHSRRIL